MNTKEIKIYTDDELKAMSQEELQEVLATTQDAEQTLSDILKQQVEAAKLVVEAKAAAVVGEVKTEVQEVEKETTSWWVAHRFDVYVIAVIAMLAYIAGNLH